MDIFHNHNKGSALVLSLVASIVIVGIAGSAIYMATTSQNLTTQYNKKMISRYVAEAGQARAFQHIKLFLMNNTLTYTEVDQYLTDRVIFNNVPFTSQRDNITYKLGTYTVVAKMLTTSNITTQEDITGNKASSVRYVEVTSISTIPTSAKSSITSKIVTTYKISSDMARVFDYCYFINNWGWFYGNNITTFGNCRSNGSFSMGSYRPTIWGKPRFEDCNGTDLIGYIDDNKDGQLNNQDGGIYSWNNIDGTPSANGRPSDLYAGLQGTSTQNDIQQLPMPNLTDLSIYETKAKQEGSYIKIGDTIICDGVLGDNEAQQHLYLEGTYEKPIQIYGINVVRGDVIIRGYVAGQGTIYSGRNIYIPQRILYRNPPSERRPSNNSESARENWRATNVGTDMLGLFSREHIVISDFTNTNWRSLVNQWLQNPSNASKEDAGIDKIPNTYDPGENDNVWSVLKDTQNNIIPGTGEDIDGDGKYDGTVTLSEFNLASSTIYTNHPSWTGNLPTGLTSFSQLSYWDETLDAPGLTGSQKFPQVDAILYTNHFLGGYFSNNNSYGYKGDNRTHFLNDCCTYFNGAVISRNESLIYDSRDIIFQHDERLSGCDGEVFHFTLPRVWKPLEVVSSSIY